MPRRVVITQINDIIGDKLIFEIKFKLSDILSLDLNDDELLKLKRARESNDYLEILEAIRLLIEKFEGIKQERYDGKSKI